MENIEVILSENVKRLRKGRKFTQEKLAENCGLSIFAIQSVESCRQWPELHTLQKIADALNVRTGDLFQYQSSDKSLELIKKISSLGPVELDLLMDNLDELSKPLPIKAKKREA